MKKFFSLVLALVMALSLTTVAWGAATALPTADANGVITLTEDVTLTFTGNAGIALADGTVIDGAGYTLTLEGNVGSYSSSAAIYNLHAGANVQIKDLVIDNNLTVGYVFSFADATLDNVDITGSTMPLALVGGAAGDEIVVKNCEFEGFVGEAISTESGAATPVSIDTCKFTGDTAVIMRNNNSSSVNSTYDADLVLYANDVTENLTGNTFNAEVNLYFGNQSLTGNSFGSDATIELKNGATDVDVSNNYWGGGAPTAAQLGGATADTYFSTADMGGITGTASTPASGANGAYFTANMTNLSVHPNCDLATYTYELKHYITGSDAAKTFDQVAIWQTHKVSGASTPIETAVVTSADSANLAFVNGATITYLNTNVTKWTATATEVATVDVEDAEKCGDVFIAGDVGVYTDANGKVYYETITGAAYNVGGKLVLLKEATLAYPVVDSAALKTAKATPAAGTVYTVKHDYDCDIKTFGSDKTVTRVFCTECKGEFAFLEGTMAEAIQKFGAGNFALETINNMPVYVAFATTSGTVSGSTTGTVIESADTFDAGIALYVGMSVMAAAGSAVVIGKKKD